MADEPTPDHPTVPPNAASDVESNPDQNANDGEAVEVEEADLLFLVEQGVSERQALLALHAVGGKGRSEALEWISENANSAQSATQSTSPKLTPEERALKVAELQKRIRDKRQAAEKKAAHEAERNRIESNKQLLEAKRKFEEAEAQRLADQMAREREEKKQAEARQKELLKQDYRERFGKELPEETLAEEAFKKKTPREKVIHLAGLLRSEITKSPETKQKVLDCVKVCRIYCVNVKDNPTDPKFQSIRLANKAFSERVAPFPNAEKLLNVLGFKKTDDGEFLQLQGMPDGFLLGEAIKFFDFILRQA